MSVLIQHRKKDNKYRAWTTIADGWLTDWLSEKGMIKYLQSRIMDRATEECENLAVEFPNGYHNKDHVRYWDDKKAENYKKLCQKRIDALK